MDERLANKIDEITDRWYRNEDYCQNRNTINTFIALKLEENGYRLDPYPNGKSKDELIARIEAVEAERDRTRFFLVQAHDDEIMGQYTSHTMQERREIHRKTNPTCPICTFLTETSTVKDGDK